MRGAGEREREDTGSPILKVFLCFPKVRGVVYFIFICLKRFIFRERRRKKERMEEKHPLVACLMCPKQDQTHNPGICPDRN